MTFSELPIGTEFSPNLPFKCRMKKVAMNRAVLLSLQGDQCTGAFRFRLSPSMEVRNAELIRKPEAA